MKNLSKKYYSLLQRYKYYTYDTLDRLLSITGHIAEEDTVNTDIFTYDVVGNRIMMTNNSPSAIKNFDKIILFYIILPLKIF